MKNWVSRINYCDNLYHGYCVVTIVGTGPGACDGVRATFSNIFIECYIYVVITIVVTVNLWHSRNFITFNRSTCRNTYQNWICGISNFDDLGC